ncbi:MULTISPECIES: RIP metalloprotease RseP [Virgibacillus]|uniref:Zinc metalloprotease n=2 Tax=Virgibacillus TaxID=84406 RepID=A0A024QCW2_9BACI|nr:MULTISPECIES: RIP metalloprotease RseP [Virgibacillus]EQB36385.1 metalloprotease RseP [Virgibacillus sp. CM-4]MYL42217.1 RIP metalloprotease RseP [Virgibacillus massiliensis]GGJ44358.1 regulator of sigma-W protease RasP [Virgibacillus kapii]CDQ40082.1 Zinc metalloprotease RasP [Virgibacillus massiliensis]
MTTVIAFILMFGLLVFIHEWGHLIFAKRAGMLAREFAIGFGPKIFSFTKNETVYTIRLLPIGGYVRVAGEDPEIIDLKPGHHVGLEFNESGKVDKIIVNHKSKHPNARIIEIEESDLDHKLQINGYDVDDQEERLCFEVDPKASFVMDERETQIAPYDRQFASKSVGQRAMQLFAGPMMNFVLAIVIFLILGVIQGVPVEEAKMGQIQPDSPAQEAGIKSDDEIIQIEDQPISTWEEFTTIVRDNPGEELDIVVQREGDEVPLTVVPKEVPATEGQPAFGQIGVYQAFEKSLLGTVTYGFTQTFDTTKLILTNLGMLITGQLPIETLSGPVGIYDATDQIVQTGFMNFLMWTAMLSINLGIVNLVPLPALDGGRLLFVGLEAVRGKPISPEKEGLFHFVGFALLMLLMIIVTWNDIQRLFL